MSTEREQEETSVSKGPDKYWTTEEGLEKPAYLNERTTRGWAADRASNGLGRIVDDRSGKPIFNARAVSGPYDAEFCVSARSAVPELIAELRRTRESLRKKEIELESSEAVNANIRALAERHRATIESLKTGEKHAGGCNEKGKDQ